MDELQQHASGIDDMIARLKEAVDQPGLPAPAHYAARLASIGLDEAAFGALMNEIDCDKGLKKVDLQMLLRAYTGRFDKRSSLPQLKDDLRRAFYTKLYERDTHAIADRATPL